MFAESPTADEFVQIFENYCAGQDLPCEPELVLQLIEQELKPRKVELRGCQPRDLIVHALSIASYFNRPRELTLDLLRAACATYFVSDGRDVATV